MNEPCIRCNKSTEYDINTPIYLHRYFVEGSGQLCEECWREVYRTESADGSATKGYFHKSTAKH